MSTDTEEDSIHITEDTEDRLFWQRNLVTPVKATTGVVKPSVADLVNRKYWIYILTSSAIKIFFETNYLMYIL